MEPFLIRLFITIGIIWLTQILLDAFGIVDPGKKIIYIIVILAGILYLLTGFPLR